MKYQSSVIFYSLALALFVSINSSAQIRRDVQKAKIMDSGVVAHVPCFNPTIDTTHNADGSIMYVVECQMEPVLYNIIVIKSQTTAGGSVAEREYRLLSYTTQFKTMMDIESCPVFKRDDKLLGNPDVIGLSYVCTGKDGVKFAIQGWQYDKEVVLYSISGPELPKTEAMNPLFNSVVFPR